MGRAAAHRRRGRSGWPAAGVVEQVVQQDLARQHRRSTAEAAAAEKHVAEVARGAHQRTYLWCWRRSGGPRRRQTRGPSPAAPRAASLGPRVAVSRRDADIGRMPTSLTPSPKAHRPPGARNADQPRLLLRRPGEHRRFARGRLLNAASSSHQAPGHDAAQSQVGADLLGHRGVVARGDLPLMPRPASPPATRGQPVSGSGEHQEAVQSPVSSAGPTADRHPAPSASRSAVSGTSTRCSITCRVRPSRRASRARPPLMVEGQFAIHPRHGARHRSPTGGASGTGSAHGIDVGGQQPRPTTRSEGAGRCDGDPALGRCPSCR